MIKQVKRLNPYTRVSHWMFLGFFYFILSPFAVAVDKSGVSSTSISIPSGPGSIEGLGADFQPQLNTGTGSYNIPINLPPAPAGKTVELSLDITTIIE